MRFVFESLFYEMAAIFAASAVIGSLAAKLRQPLIVAFIAVGVLVGPAGLDAVSAHEQIRLFAELGIALLLFVVGLRLDVHLIRTTGPVALVTGLGQVVFTSVIGFLIGRGLGLGAIEALYVAVALTFSSTIIIVKLLSDKREIDSLHGRIALGFLIVQDLAAVAALIGLTALGAGTVGGGVLGEGLWVLAKGVAFVGAIGAVMRYGLPGLVSHAARSQELLVLFSVAWAVVLSATGSALGFSKEVGAFLAGVSLASTPYRETIGSRLTSLRDFLLLFFFLDLGAQLDLSVLGAQVGSAVVFSVFVLVGNPLIVMALMGAMGYRKRTGFLAGLTVAQISEFSLILGAMGVSLGHLSREAMGLITLVGLVTIGVSTYLILYSYPLYGRLSGFLGVFERRIPHREGATDSPGEAAGPEILIFGLGRYGRNIAGHLVERGRRVLGVDFDPQVVAQCRQAGLPVRYGDAEDPDVLENLPLESARWVVGAAPGREVNLALLHSLRARGYRGKVVLTAHDQADASAFQAAGADRVLWPFVDAAEQAVDVVSETAHEVLETYPWPVILAELRVRTGSSAAGRTLRELALRSRTGANVLAVARAGTSLFDLGADFQVYPGDRLVLAGTRESLDKAAAVLREASQEPNRAGRFRISEVGLDPGSPWAGRALADVDLTARSHVTVIGIRRGADEIVNPGPGELLRAGDRLVIAGPEAAIESLAATAPGARAAPEVP